MNVTKTDAHAAALRLRVFLCPEAELAPCPPDAGKLCDNPAFFLKVPLHLMG